MVNNADQGGLTALIHPVSVAIISNHFTRCVLLNSGKYVQVVGALLGKQDAKFIEVQNCFEVESKVEDGRLVVNLEYFREREKLFNETFPNQTFLGFYVTGDHLNVDENDLRLHEQALKVSEFAFLLKLSPLIGQLNDKVPVSVFEANVDHHQSGQTVLSPIPVKVISDVAERIGTDHAAKFTTAGDKHETTASKKLCEQRGAIKMLWKGLALAMDYLNAVEQNQLAPHPEILRELHKLAIKISFLRRGLIQPKGQDEDDLSDNMIVLLTMSNKIASSVFSLITKLNAVASESQAVCHSTPMKRKENI